MGRYNDAMRDAKAVIEYNQNKERYNSTMANNSFLMFKPLFGCLQEKAKMYGQALISLRKASKLTLSENDARSVAAAVERVSTHILQEVRKVHHSNIVY